MALLHFDIKSIGRSAGRSAPAAAAYRAGERIRDERTGKLHNYSRRRDVIHAEIFLPSNVPAGEATWARARSTLWNAVEAAERRRDSRVAREVQVALPVELSPEQRLELARGFSRELADRYRVAVDLAVHEPRPEGDPRNFHAHLLLTTREVTGAGLGRKAGLDAKLADSFGRQRDESAKEMRVIRERWASRTNDALQAAGVEARVDPRSLAAQGIDRLPRPQIPFVAYQMERRGLRSEVAERIRQRYRERVAAHAAGRAPESAAAALESRRQPGASAEATPGSLTRDATGLEDIRRRARAAWLQLRREAARTGHRSARPANETSRRAEQPSRAASRESSPGASDGTARDSADEDLAL